jgi:hypothetical protein
MVAARTADGEIMQAGQPWRNCPSRPDLCARYNGNCRELRPEGGLEREILAYTDDAEIGQRGRHFGHRRIDGGGRCAVKRDRGVMLAKAGASGSHIVLGPRQFAAQRQGLILAERIRRRVRFIRQAPRPVRQRQRTG